MAQKDIRNYIPGVEAQRAIAARGGSRRAQFGHAIEQVCAPVTERLDRNNPRNPDGTYNTNLVAALGATVIDLYAKFLPAVVGSLLGAPLGPLGIAGGAILGAAVGTEAEHMVAEVVVHKYRRSA